MSMKRVFAALAGALVAGLVLGSVTSGFAATATTSTGNPAATISAACGSLGLRLGATMRDSGGRMLDVVAKLTGTSVADVTTKRQAGETLTQIAAEKNISSTAVVDEALKVRQQVLAAKVKDGSITRAQADAALATMKTRMADRVNNVNTNCGMGGGGGRGAGCGGGGCGAAGAAVTQ
jgi:hypothetical protein